MRLLRRVDGGDLGVRQQAARRQHGEEVGGDQLDRPEGERQQRRERGARGGAVEQREQQRPRAVEPRAARLQDLVRRLQDALLRLAVRAPPLQLLERREQQQVGAGERRRRRRRRRRRPRRRRPRRVGGGGRRGGELVAHRGDDELGERLGAEHADAHRLVVGDGEEELGDERPQRGDALEVRHRRLHKLVQREEARRRRAARHRRLLAARRLVRQGGEALARERGEEVRYRRVVEPRRPLEQVVERRREHVELGRRRLGAAGGDREVARRRRRGGRRLRRGDDPVELLERLREVGDAGCGMWGRVGVGCGVAWREMGGHVAGDGGRAARAPAG